MRRKYWILTGQVQGVGFRPSVYRWALECSLTGQVGNTPDGVRIEAQGPPDAVERFQAGLFEHLPPLARIQSLRHGELEPRFNEEAFGISASEEGDHQGHSVLISPDVATCPACVADTLDPHGRRKGYPFTNCTDCGPRYSITRSIPYDRPVTSMACFPLCPQCAAEYADPLNRRFHAQPNACPLCGPQVWLVKSPPGETHQEQTGPESGHPVGPEAVRGLLQALREGAIAAVKGLGGFHLVCDAHNPQAITRLRQRKNRPHKALAVMVPDMAAARRLAQITPQAETALTSWQRPIVICPRLAGSVPGAHQARPGPAVLPACLAPDSADIGLLLPYTPLHHLLFHPEALGGSPGEALAALVMTSGNAGGEPICLGNREALWELGHIADIFLFHNRDILIRVDDSVLFAGTDAPAGEAGPTLMLRRARGFVPSPLQLPLPLRGTPPTSVLAMGGQMKHTFCLTRNAEAFVSQHIGELDRPGQQIFFEETLAHLTSLLEVTPQMVVCDAHPDYLSSRLAHQYAQARHIPLQTVQHHLAHIYAVMAEHNRAAPCLGLAVDGSGLGLDGTLWGGELVWADPVLPQGGERVGSLRPLPLPGGEAAIREPWRIAQGLMAQLQGWNEETTMDARLFPWLGDPPRAAIAPLITELCTRGVNTPWTSSCGRLFDAVAALCGLCFETTYEGQGAILLEQAQDWSEPGAYPLPLRRAGDEPLSAFSPAPVPLMLDTYRMLEAVLEDRRRGVPVGRIARRFHRGLARGLAELAQAGAERYGVGQIALAGGVLNNRTLADMLPKMLRNKGLFPLLPQMFPSGDGALSLGQATWAYLAQAQGVF